MSYIPDSSWRGCRGRRKIELLSVGIPSVMMAIVNDLPSSIMKIVNGILSIMMTIVAGNPYFMMTIVKRDRNEFSGKYS